jgi:hypothetical protein
MLYIDRELDAERALAFEEHLAECADCAAFLERNRRLEELFEATLSPSQSARRTEDFLRNVHERIGRIEPDIADTVSVHPVRRGKIIRIVAAAGIAAAAAVVLLMVFHSRPTRKIPGAEPDVSRTAAPPPGPGIERPADQIAGSSADSAATPVAEVFPFPLPADSAERLAAHREFSRILAGLDAVGQDELKARFAKTARSLKSEGWRVDILLTGALKREQGPALRTAIRLVGSNSGNFTMRTAIPDLERLLVRKAHPVECMNALAALGGARPAAAIGRMLRDDDLGQAALGCLERMPPGDAAPVVTAALLEPPKPSAEAGAPKKPDPFAGAALNSLTRMGRPGITGLIKVLERKGCGSAVVRLLYPFGPEFTDELVAMIHEMRGSARTTGLQLAAALRLEKAVPLLAPGTGIKMPNGERLSLVSRIGGDSAIVALVEIFEGPVSLRERNRTAEALAAVFDLYPDEAASDLYTVLSYLDPESRDTLIEMLSRAGTDGACRALAWIVENWRGLAIRASLAMAQTGSPEALALLAEILAKNGMIDDEVRLAAGAAAYHLGGDDFLDWIHAIEMNDPGAGPRGPQPTKSSPHQRGSLSEFRFQKLQEQFARATGS